MRAVLRHQVSWGAILAGAVMALVTQLVLNIVGVGVGLASIGTDGAAGPGAATLSLGAGLWWVVSGILASLAGGALAGRLSGKPDGSTSGFHGLVSWAVTTLVVIYLLTSTAGGILGGAFNTVAGALGGAGSALGSGLQTAAQTAAPALGRVANPLDGIEQRVREAASGQDPAALRDAAAAAMRAYLTGDPAQRQQAETRAAEALAKAQNIPADQARQQIQDYQRQYEQALASAKQKAEAAAATAKSAATQGAFYAALALMLGALAAFLGGRLGAVGPQGPALHRA
ncbi:MAG: PhnA-like protein [Methylobacterium sp.]|uniref:PhnA-like protein n=1 Tax=Methylobacterium sp. TaxID=409 RepID=UPI00258723C3|nr:PhnA-like protein [Methylobacterium sp.]MBY0295644.1 PhnA-like protein [Methylobacterium sp.]